ncbi:hypothetical protein [Janibacter anophelis]|nr:hypothetical protein [Janibacter anophelis]
MAAVLPDRRPSVRVWPDKACAGVLVTGLKRERRGWGAKRPKALDAPPFF